MTKLSSEKVENLLDYSRTNKNHQRKIDHCGYFKVLVADGAETKEKVLNVVYFRDEISGLAILVRDDKDRLRDYCWDVVDGRFYQLTNRNEKINWKNNGFSETPGIALDYIVGDFDDSCYEIENAVISFAADDINSMVAEITEKEPAVAKALEMVVKHIHGTYSDKYAKGQDVIDTKKMLYDAKRGDFLNIYQVSRYLQRYITQGSAKSHLIKDIEKAIHYLIFELTRRILMGDVDEIEPKV